MASTTIPEAEGKEVTLHLPNLVKVFKDGSIERLQNSPLVPPSLESSVSSKDVVISNNPSISARLYLPTSSSTTATTKKSRSWCTSTAEDSSLNLPSTSSTRTTSTCSSQKQKQTS
ncbi:hypothetical protein PIB30_040741 [Stylosanthes scabra]|uniref:Uncharacterized protein n=1 Tax=Stylosanthes scabra TaxID=79078 RepID=A0ABU6WD34_9FABA|nr:hypothetical protein [Stylosanthes scabra]